MGGAKPNTRKACWTNSCPTPWKEEWMNFNVQLLFRSLKETEQLLVSDSAQNERTWGKKERIQREWSRSYLWKQREVRSSI